MQERAENDLDVVVGVDLVAISEFVVDAAVRLESTDSEIMACGEYQTSTSVESSAGSPSTGVYSEKPVRSAARSQTGAFNVPSSGTPSSKRGIRTASWPARPLYVSARAALSGDRTVIVSGDTGATPT